VLHMHTMDVARNGPLTIRRTGSFGTFPATAAGLPEAFQRPAITDGSLSNQRPRVQCIGGLARSDGPAASLRVELFALTPS